ncbi:unnamed protein product, partial [Onchocerca flexuosa]|uniref:Transmembrane protein n=1 Tax=Onchocerca flexuosa TaxID=387005 RepID=A0A183HRM9_9BILA
NIKTLKDSNQFFSAVYQRTIETIKWFIHDLEFCQLLQLMTKNVDCDKLPMELVLINRKLIIIVGTIIPAIFYRIENSIIPNCPGTNK